MRKKKTARYTKIAIVIARRCHCHHPHHRYNGYTDDLDAHVTREQYQNASACARARRISSTQWHSNIGILCACFVCSAYIVFTLEFVNCSEWRKISHSGKWWLIDLHLPHATLSLARSVTPLMCFHANCHFFTQSTLSCIHMPRKHDSRTATRQYEHRQLNHVIRFNRILSLLCSLDECRMIFQIRRSGGLFW